tara:strand:+ start:5138 stop:7009 length:1872 start_codon:yes stop_codon:yes gene_type:complete
MNKDQIKKDYPFSTKIIAEYQVVHPKERDEHLALASLDSLKALLDVPKEQIEMNRDLLYISADLWVGGMANKNGHAITTEDTIALAKQIPHKYLNLEHDEDVVVGSLFSYGFREYANERNLISEEDIEDLNKPIVASGGGFVWRSIKPELAELLVEASDKNSLKYGQASFSWEVYFKEFSIMEGSKFVDQAEIIDDESEIEKRLPFLKDNGGSGEYEGKEIYRLVKGPKLFLGAGIVGNPAADVKGILTTETKEDVETKLEANDNSSKVSKTVEKSLQTKLTDHKEKVGSDKRKQTTLGKLKIVYNRGIGAYNTNPSSVRPTVSSPQQWAQARVNSFLHVLRNLKFRSGKHDTDLLPTSHPMAGKDKKKAKISQSKKINVKKYTAMKIKNQEDYKTVLASVCESEEVDHKLLASLEANFDKVTASAIADAIRDESAKFATEKKELEEAKTMAAEEKAKIEAELTELKEKSEASDKELEEIKAKLVAEEQSRIFSERMEALEKDYDLEADDSKVIAKQIKGLDEGGYDAWLGDFKVFAKEKSKDYKMKKAEEMKKQEEEEEAVKAKASTEETEEQKESREKEDAEKLIASAQEDVKQEVASTQHEEKVSLEDQFSNFELELEGK